MTFDGCCCCDCCAPDSSAGSSIIIIAGLTGDRMKIKGSPSSCSVRKWLDQSLEERGIDARVYGKYILSLVTETQDDCSSISEGQDSASDLTPDDVSLHPSLAHH